MPRRLGGKRLERVNGRLVEVPDIGPKPVGDPCPQCGKRWINGDCGSTVSRRALCIDTQRRVTTAGED